MLVLSRKRKEQIIIAQTIEITVLAVRGNHVRLGISAPREVSIRRGELERDSNKAFIPHGAAQEPTTENARAGPISMPTNT